MLYYHIFRARLDFLVKKVENDVAGRQETDSM
jgi:hypothetical protein